MFGNISKHLTQIQVRCYKWDPYLLDQRLCNRGLEWFWPIYMYLLPNHLYTKRKQPTKTMITDIFRVVTQQLAKKMNALSWSYLKKPQEKNTHTHTSCCGNLTEDPLKNLQISPDDASPAARAQGAGCWDWGFRESPGVSSLFFLHETSAGFQTKSLRWKKLYIYMYNIY